MAHAQKTNFVFRRNGRVHLNRRGRQFSPLLAAEVYGSAVVMLDTPCYEMVWRLLATHSIRQFPLNFPSRASPCAVTFQLQSTILHWPERSEEKAAKIPFQFSQIFGKNLNPEHLEYIATLLITRPRPRYITLHGFKRSVASDCFIYQHSSDFKLPLLSTWDQGCSAMLRSVTDVSKRSVVTIFSLALEDGLDSRPEGLLYPWRWDQ